jgi:predicted glycogen debranching enzyme
MAPERARDTVSEMTLRFDPAAEWLEADGLGGFASGTVDGVRTRRYHALLLVATTPPTGRLVLVNGFDAVVETAAGSFALTSQRYPGDVLSPDGARHLVAFEPRPWPRWRWKLPDGTEIEQELFVPQGAALTALSWRRSAGTGVARLVLRPFLSGRDYHGLHHENGALRFEAEDRGGRLRWRPYDGVPAVIAVSNGRYEHAPDWYRRFLYTEERSRGLDYEEDLATPGRLHFDLAAGEAVLLLASEGQDEAVLAPDATAASALELLRSSEQRRRKRFTSPLHQSASAYLVRRGAGHTLIAGYPWFTDWGRDTFIALRGLCLATGQLEIARAILVEWADAVSEGMLPNRFADRGETPEFNAVDASLWFVICVQEYLAAAELRSGSRAPRGQRRLLEATEAILEGYTKGTRFGIRCDDDGLLQAGQPGVQLTWMDARVGDRVITPRAGKPVEVQALWLNALQIGRSLAPRLEERFRRGLESFRARFWCDATGCLYDVVDVDHVAGTADATLRPNQILAVGGLPQPLLSGQRARLVVEAVERVLAVPLALRSLPPDAPGYVGRYEGGPSQRDGAYHQGTAWPWLLGPFVEAWVRVRGGTPAVKSEARVRFLEPLHRHLCEAGLGHVSELVDGDTPHTPRGCPFQAWSLGEMLRLELQVLAAPEGAR